MTTISATAPAAPPVAYYSAIITTFALAVAFFGIYLSVRVLLLQLEARRSRRRVAVAWRILDDCMRDGYRRKHDRKLTQEMVDEWLTRTARFCATAFGYHARELILQDQRLGLEGKSLTSIIGDALFRIHVHIADKVLEGRIGPDFDENKWQGWTPAQNTPVHVSLDD